MLSRRTFLQATAAPAFVGFATHARAAEFNLKLAHNQPTTHPSHIRSAEAVERVRAETGGKVELQIFPSSQLGSDTDTRSQLRSGAVDFFFLSPIILSTLVAKASINGVAFAFPDYDTVWKTMDGPLGAFVSNEVSKANLVIVGRIWDKGFRQITTSNKPIRGPEDLKGFKIRVPVSPLWTSLFKALG